MRLKLTIAIAAASLLLSSCSPDVECWRVLEIPFESEFDYSSNGADDITMDVTFTNSKTGETMTVPAFWDGGKTFRVRFAPVAEGRWQWKTECPEDSSLSGLTGRFLCGRYSGNLDIYKHGFIQAEAGRKYITYADGTPFFYLGDTHWGMYREEIDEAGPNAGSTRTESHFKYIVSRRAEQGFTVYQSEPIDSKFNLDDGKVDASDIEGFQLADRYYQHIADEGLVHANAELFFPNKRDSEYSDTQLEKLSRYWVARFGAYPVIWTTAQEVDNDFYHVFDSKSNPWTKVAEYIHRYDAYSHPLSAHMENACMTAITYYGEEGASMFASPEVAEKTGHNWWAVQWSPSLTEEINFGVPADFWNSEYPAVNYEGRYCYLWTKDFGERAQGWISFLTGFCGYGYGAIDMWLYKSTYDIDNPSFDGVDSISVADKQVPWCDAIEFESAHQMKYLKDYLQSFDWWNLVPVLDSGKEFSPEEGALWACAHTPDRYVLYSYGNNTMTGTLNGLNSGSKVTMAWFDPLTGAETSAGEATVASDGTLVLPQKPDCHDWVLTVSFE